MSINIGNTISLETWLNLCQNAPDAVTWVVYKEGCTSYSTNMKLDAVTLDNYDIEPEEYMDLEEQVLAQGFSNALNPDQVTDIISNLSKIKPSYSVDDLILAINFYSKHDTFIDIAKTSR